MKERLLTKDFRHGDRIVIENNVGWENGLEGIEVGMRGTFCQSGVFAPNMCSIYLDEPIDGVGMCVIFISSLDFEYNYDHKDDGIECATDDIENFLKGFYR